MENLHGVYGVLVILPIWATALILYIVTQGVLFILRDRREGLYYNTSYSAILGDGALIVVVLMAAEILQRGGTSLPTWGQSGHFHLLAIIAAIFVGVFWFMVDVPEQWGDRYHHLVIAPLLCYLGITLIPMVYLNGSNFEVVATACLILLWAGLVVYDAKTHRLDQRNYRNLGMHLSVIKEYGRWKHFKLPPALKL